MSRVFMNKAPEIMLSTERNSLTPKQAFEIANKMTRPALVAAGVIAIKLMNTDLSPVDINEQFESFVGKYEKG